MPPKKQKADCVNESKLQEVATAIARVDEALQSVPAELYGEFVEAAMEMLQSRLPEPPAAEHGPKRRRMATACDGHGHAHDHAATKPKSKESPAVTMEAIRTWVRDQVAADGCVDSESIVYSGTGRFQDHTDKNTVSVDAFLYDDDEVDTLLVDTGKLSRNYCKACGSRDTAPFNFISHSMSVPELRFIFEDALPDLQGKTVVDVGSRLGPVLFAGVLFSKAKELVGVEMTEAFCNIQNRTIKNFDLGSRARVVCADIKTQGDLLKTADVVILHNVFQFFWAPEVAAGLWEMLRSSLSKGCIVISDPGVEEQVADAGVKNSKAWTRKWLSEMEVERPPVEEEDEEDEDGDGFQFSSLRFYTVQ